MNEKKEKVIQYLLEHIYNQDKKYIEKALNSFSISKSTAYSYVKELETNGTIEKNEGAFPYRLSEEKHFFHYEINNNLFEDRIFNSDLEALFSDLDKEVMKIWRYSICEMINNAIEHSKGKNLYLTVFINALNIRVIIIDDGIGIFKNIQSFIKTERNEEMTIEECASLLLAGKFTTAKENHSGEGIFFTSLIMDEFFISSGNHIYYRNSFKSGLLKKEDDVGGTNVVMSLSKKSRKKLRKVFDEFSNEDGFFKTQIPIVSMFPSGIPVSRSEARRLCSLIGDFKEVVLDFTDTDDIGQSFAHELFVLWQEKNPDIKLTVINANEDVEFMINRALKTAGMK